MSTEERWTDVLGKCPCGQGTVTQCVVSPDNMYSKTTRTVTINCPNCSSDWKLVGRTLILESSTAEAASIQQKLSELEQQIRSIKDEVIAGYFARKGIKTMKGEWEEMHRLGFYTESLGTFRNRRGTIAAPPVFQFSGMNVDEGWLMEQASLTNAKVRLEEQYRLQQETRAALQAARQKIRQRSLDDLEPAGN